MGCHIHGIEARDGTYTIAKDRLREGHTNEHPYSWIGHLSGKSWIDLDDFATAYFVAIAMHGQRLTRSEVSLLDLHMRKACEAARLRPFHQIAMEEFGIGDFMSMEQLAQFARKPANLPPRPRDEAVSQPERNPP